MQSAYVAVRSWWRNAGELMPEGDELERVSIFEGNIYWAFPEKNCKPLLKIPTENSRGQSKNRWNCRGYTKIEEKTWISMGGPYARFQTGQLQKNRYSTGGVGYNFFLEKSILCNFQCENFYGKSPMSTFSNIFSWRHPAFTINLSTAGKFSHVYNGTFCFIEIAFTGCVNKTRY